MLPLSANLTGLSINMYDLVDGVDLSHDAGDSKDSSSFIAPPIDGSMYLPEMVDYHLQYNENHTFTLLVGDDYEDVIRVSMGEVARAVHRLAARFIGDIPDGPANIAQRPKTIAILANLDNLTYATILLGLLRAGFEVFPLSLRNSTAALKHLLEVTGTSCLVGSIPHSCSPSSLQATTQTLLNEIPNLKLIPVPKAVDVYPRLSKHPVPSYDAKKDGRVTPLLPPVRSLNSYQNADLAWPCLIIHSSGSTNFPKPIRLHNSVVTRQIGRKIAPCSYKAGTVSTGMVLPLFHVMGVFVVIGSPFALGVVSVMFKPAELPKVPTPENSLSAMRKAGADLGIVPPSFVQEWAEDSEAVKYLSSLHGLLYGGGPLPRGPGDHLVHCGVNLLTGYGLTETGPNILMSPENGTLGIHDWDYVQVAPDIRGEFVREDDNRFRLVVVETEKHPLAAHNVEGQHKFDTYDLFEEHSEHKGFWRVLGRSDDQIMMSNSEKTNPGPLESIIVSHPAVRAAIMFGRARTQVGVLVEPAHPIQIEEDAEVEAFRNEIWPSIEKANAFAPAHSRIFKEFILVIDPVKKPFFRTPKVTIARNATLQAYEKEINSLYEAAEDPIKADWAKPPSTWDDATTRAFVKRVVNGVMRGGAVSTAKVEDERDLFEQGCDSLQATYIRNALLNAARQAPHPGKEPSSSLARQLEQDLVFKHPSVRQLADYLVDLISGDPHQGPGNADPQARQVAAMLTLVEKYSSNLSSHQPQDAGPAAQVGEVILLTGSTGTLGTYLLQSLLLDPKIIKVYAANRASLKGTIAERQEQAFKDKGVDIGLLKSDRLVLLEVEFREASLGLEGSILDHMRKSVTAIIHNAWRLDFNLSLQSFEPLVKGTRNLVNLALSSHRPMPPQIIFTSSIGTVANWHELIPVPEEPIDDPRVALGIGYGESKWVAERVLMAAAEQGGIKTTIWRIGQLTGSILNGAWSTTDWVPILVKSGQVMGQLPTLPGLVSWLPTDRAAQAIIDGLHNSDFSGGRYLHLVHPRPVTWETIVEKFSAELALPLCSYEDWLSYLEQAQSDPDSIERNPAVRLLPFFRSGLGIGMKTTEAIGMADLETKKAVQVSATLGTLPSLGEDDVRKWMEYWKKYGFFD